jgi:hypothetical protein
LFGIKWRALGLLRRIEQRCVRAEKERLCNNLPNYTLVDQVILVIDLLLDEPVVLSSTELSGVIHVRSLQHG